MTAPLSYQDDIRLRARRPSMFAPRVEPQSGDVIIDSGGTYDRTPDGRTVRRQPREVVFAVETHAPGYVPEPLWVSAVCAVVVAAAFVGMLVL